MVRNQLRAQCSEVWITGNNKIKKSMEINGSDGTYVIVGIAALTFCW
jgi:hypothetical protein